MENLTDKEIDQFFLIGPIDLNTSPINDINRFQLARLKARLDLLLESHEVKLCDEIPLGIMIEYRFRANSIKDVLVQLQDMVTYRISNPFQEFDRVMLASQAKRFSLYQAELRGNPFRIRARAFFETAVRLSARGSGNGNLVLGLHQLSIKMEEMIAFNATQKHERKECACYFQN